MSEQQGPINFRTGDIIQITDEHHHWYTCLLIIVDVRDWDVIAYALIPHNDGGGAGKLPARIEYGHFQRVGTAAIGVFSGIYSASAPDERQPGGEEAE